MIEDRDENLCETGGVSTASEEGEGGESLPAGRLALGSTIEVAWRADKMPLLLGPRPPAPFGLYMVGELNRETEDCWRGGCLAGSPRGQPVELCNAVIRREQSNHKLPVETAIEVSPCSRFENVDSPVLGEKANLVCLNVKNQDDVLMQAAHHKEGPDPLKAGRGYRVGKTTPHSHLRSTERLDRGNKLVKHHLSHNSGM